MQWQREASERAGGPGKTEDWRSTRSTGCVDGIAN
jgi:hypothetical protein